MKNSIDIDVLDNPDYLHIRLIGILSPITEGDFVRLLADVVAQKNIKYALVDLRNLENRTSVFMNYFTAEKLAKTRLMKIQKIAMVAPASEETACRYAELASRNQGLNLRFFFVEDEAVAWLMENKLIKLNAEHYQKIIDSGND